MNTKIFFFILLSSLVIYLGCSKNPSNNTKADVLKVNTNATAKAKQTNSSSSIAGTYRCWHYEINDAPVEASCRTFAPLVLNADGTYNLSSERGTYTLTDDQLILSESKLRGPGTLLENGEQIMFEYTVGDQDQRITYLRDQGSGTSSQATDVNIITVDLSVAFAEDDGRVGWINVMKLVSEDNGLQYETLATADESEVVSARFYEVQVDSMYTAYASTGTDEFVVGTVDLQNVDTTESVIPIDLTFPAEGSSTNVNVCTDENLNSDDPEEEPVFYYEFGPGREENPGGPEY